MKTRFLLALAGLYVTTAGLATAATMPPASLADCDAQAHAQVLKPATAMPAAVHWFTPARLRWPGPTAGPDAGPGGRYVLAHAASGGIQASAGQALSGHDGQVRLQTTDAALPPAVAQRFRFVAAGIDLQMPAAALRRVPELLRGQLVLAELDAAGLVLRATALQTPGVLDEVYAEADAVRDWGVSLTPRRTAFRLWAPTARSVSLCLYPAGDDTPAQALLPMRRDARTGSWQASLPRDRGNLRAGNYSYLVDVHVRGAGLVRNRVTDPYSISLNTDSRRSWIGSLDAPATKPPGWDSAPRPSALPASTDAVVYELHVRDFSASDASVPAALRGRYAAFTQRDSAGMQHLRRLGEAGVTDIHLLPIFDLATVPERGCLTPEVSGTPDGEQQQAAVKAVAERDCYNWGYDPWHYGAPEGSYASDASDGAVRVRELRAMVQALHAAGLRVGMDLVYNHTAASGQALKSVLDRIVPGYYQRLNAAGTVETSTCCDNTATEHRMMARLMVDTAAQWARHYRIDSFRFDLMGHQPRAAMEQLQRAVDRAAGRHIPLIGEGWNFGEIANGARFVQASQASLNGSGIASFSDRGRDAVRGGGCCDDAAGTLSRQGWLNGQFHAPNALAGGENKATREDLLRSADLVRVGLAGTLRGYRLRTRDGSVKALADIDYAGQPAGFASQPGEVVNYVENHDNPTLFDINVLKLPRETSREDRARIQVAGLAVTAFSQGLAYFHAGVELLRSKSLDRNSFDSGDWFNRIDWTATTNHFGSGLPPKDDNGALWPAMKPLLADAANIAPTPAEIRFTRDAFLDLLRIRSSSTLFRLRSADAVSKRLKLLNTGPEQEPTVVVGQLDGRGLAGAGFADVLYAINVGAQATTLALPELKGRAYQLHPVHRKPGAADRRPAEASSWNADTAALTVPARTALVYVIE